ncbi:MAG TPA: maleylpyruvate isomerase family mycothiol-dependent enzyme [Sporichthyaceae bacterium]
MEFDGIYRASRTRLTALAAELTPEQAATVVPACPDWTVADVYRHLTGLVADVLDGNLDGRGSPAWTAAQVAGRAGQPLPQVCAEWAERAPEFEALFATTGLTNVRSCIDVHAHENDILGTLGRRGDRDDAALDSLVEILIAMLSGVTEFPAATRIEVGERVLTLGAGDPELTLRTTPYEFLRMVLGRRSVAQLAAADWSGPDPQRVFAALSRFPLPVQDIVD